MLVSIIIEIQGNMVELVFIARLRYPLDMLTVNTKTKSQDVGKIYGVY